MKGKPTQGVLVLDGRHWHIVDRAHPKFAGHVFRIALAMKSASSEHFIKLANDIAGSKFLGTELHPKLLSKHRNFIAGNECSHKFVISNGNGVMSVHKKCAGRVSNEPSWRETDEPF